MESEKMYFLLYLKSEQVINSADDDVDGGGVAGLRSQVVLPLEVVTLASELDEAEQGAGELGVVHVLLASSAVGTAAQALGLGVTLKSVQVEHTARAHQTSDRGEETNILLLLQVIQHTLKNHT